MGGPAAAEGTGSAADMAAADDGSTAGTAIQHCQHFVYDPQYEPIDSTLTT